MSSCQTTKSFDLYPSDACVQAAMAWQRRHYLGELQLRGSACSSRLGEMGQMRRAGLVALVIAGGAALSACGAAEMARDTGRMFDRYGCLARQWKGEPPCPPGKP